MLTTAGGRRHELARGDGLCFVSEQRHNVSTIEAGVRRSLGSGLGLGLGLGLGIIQVQKPYPNPNPNPTPTQVRRSFVLEIWGGPPNTRNRHS